MLSRLVSHRSHCLPSRAFNPNTKRHLKISRPRRALLVSSIAATPRRLRTPAPRRPFSRVVASILLEGFGVACLVGVITSARKLVKTIQDVFQLKDQLTRNVECAIVLTAFVVLSIVLAYLVLSLIDWGWSWYKSKLEKQRMQQLENMMRQKLSEISIAKFSERLSLPEDSKKEQVAVLEKKWTVASLYRLCHTCGTFEFFYASLGKDGLHDATISEIWNLLQEEPTPL